MAEFSHAALTDEMMKDALPTILNSLPIEWRGTTFKNSNLLGRGQFCANLCDLIASKGSKVTTQDLIDLGNAEDYLRVSSNISTLLEVVLATEVGYDVSQIFSFSSKAMPIVAVLLTVSTPVHYYIGENGVAPFTTEELAVLKLANCDLVIHKASPSSAHKDCILLSSVDVDGGDSSIVDGIVHPNVLYIRNTTKVNPAKILIIRKRMSTPMTTPMAEAMLQSIAKVPVTANLEEADATSLADLYAHLQTLSGTAVNTSCNPVCFTSGLPTISALWLTLLSQGGADVLMASTAYGGSSELTDIYNSRGEFFHKHKFHVQGQNDISESIQTALNTLSADATKLLPTTVLFVEIPTNPDMKVPDITVLAGMLSAFQTATQRKVLLLVDTTFAPGCRIMQKVDEVAPDLCTMAFISMSKSVSRGKTTAGALVASHCAKSCALLEAVRSTGTMLDTIAKKDQLFILAQNHTGVEERCANAYAVANAAGNALVDAVKRHCGVDMPLAFVSPANAALGFTSSTFSFNLPAIQEASPARNEGLAQQFVDQLEAHENHFKPCVSFGQDNGLVYATVPATSTQGAIHADDKAKQAVGGVQLTRLSFPPTCNVNEVCEIISNAVAICYHG